VKHPRSSPQHSGSGPEERRRFVRVEVRVERFSVLLDPAGAGLSVLRRYPSSRRSVGPLTFQVGANGTREVVGEQRRDRIPDLIELRGLPTGPGLLPLHRLGRPKPNVAPLSRLVQLEILVPSPDGVLEVEPDIEPLLSSAPLLEVVGPRVMPQRSCNPCTEALLVERRMRNTTRAVARETR